MDTLEFSERFRRELDKEAVIKLPGACGATASGISPGWRADASVVLMLYLFISHSGGD